MNAEDKKKLKEAAKAIEAALASLIEAHKVIDGLREQEEAEINEAEDQDSNRMLARRDALETLVEVVDKLDDIVNELPGIRDEIDSY